MDEEKKEMVVQPTDADILKQGNPDLLIYPAIYFDEGTVVGNGKHTQDVKKSFDARKNPLIALTTAHSRWQYEPDAPNYTPRISGCYGTEKAALSIIKRAK